MISTLSIVLGKKIYQQIDSLTRLFCSIVDNTIYKIHDSLCHPGVTRTHHFLKQKNIVASVNEVRNMVKSCWIYQEIKPRFFNKSTNTQLIKATHSFYRIHIDFKGPLSSATGNKYFLTIADECSRFPFAIPCADILTPTVIKYLCSIFSLFGLPGYVHSDRGPSFLSEELKQWFHLKNIRTSKTPFFPAALHSIRSLLCTATNVTPHERMFTFPRKSATGESMPSWLSPGPVYLKRRIHTSKHDPLVDEVELLEVNPNYAHVRFPDGREDTVSLRHLAPRDTAGDTRDTDVQLTPGEVDVEGPTRGSNDESMPEVFRESLPPPPTPKSPPPEITLRKSERTKPGPREKLDL